MPDPFGLKGGSTPPTGMVKYMLSFHAVPRPHPALQSYMGTWTPEAGMTMVSGYSRSFDDESDCRSARSLYDQLKRQIDTVYGPHQSLELIDGEALWGEDGEFWQSLNNDERSHLVKWNVASGARLDSGIVAITLSVLANDSYDSSQVALSYEFSGHSADGLADEYGLDSL